MRLWPRVPRPIVDDLALLRIARLRAQVPMLYATLIAVVTTAMLAASFEASFAVRFGLPLLVIAAAVFRLGWWLSHGQQTLDADGARVQIRRTIAIGTAIAALCSLWMIASWSMSDPGERSYYPMFLGMGVLTAAFCMASVRCATAAILAVGNLPVAATLLVAGNRMDQFAAAIVLLATVFLARLITDQHRQQVEMLMLRRQLRDQAMTDPLTGLANRRALADAGSCLFAEPNANPALILIDLDGFKPVNDRHGHAAGDTLLVRVGERLRAAAGADARVARIGGDEFGILVTGDDGERLAERAHRLLAALIDPFDIGEARVRIGASAGMARCPEDGASLAELFAAADRALYAAKGAGPNDSGAARPSQASHARAPAATSPGPESMGDRIAPVAPKIARR